MSQGKFLLNCHSKETIQCLLFVFSGLKILLCKKILWFITYGSGHPVTLHQDALIETGNTEVNNVGTMLPVLIGTSWCNRKSPVVGAREILRFEFSKRNIRKTFSIWLRSTNFEKLSFESIKKTATANKDKWLLRNWLL